MKQNLVKIIEELTKIKHQIDKNDVILNESHKRWFDDCTFLLDELHERDERIRKLERIIVEDRISKL